MLNGRRRADAEMADSETKSAEVDRELFLSRLGDIRWVGLHGRFRFIFDGW